MLGHATASIIGNLTRDVELTHFPDGTVKASLSLAVNNKWTTQAGEKKEEVSYFDASLVGKGAAVLAEFTRKGSPLYITGKLKQERWEGKSDGVKHSKVVLRIDDFRLLSGKPENDDTAQAAPKPAGPGKKYQPPLPATPMTDADIPF